MTPLPGRAVFLDRDGVLNAAIIREGRPYAPETVKDFRILPGVREACETLRRIGFHTIVVTNQPEVGRGSLPRSRVEEMHRRLCEEVPIDQIEVCYDPGQGQPSEFRKPAPGMLLRAARDLHLDLARSFMVGDRWRDIDSGHAAGCKTIFIDHGYAEKLSKPPHYRARDLSSAVQIILSLEEVQE
jgi:D-glycero-D-manno-heptose 1,7-bisphosphate phosphatase